LRWPRRHPRSAATAGPDDTRVKRGMWLFFGPAQVGPYTDERRDPSPPRVTVCPKCSLPMVDHRVERGLGTSRTICP
jgi:hypothetical protein